MSALAIVKALYDYGLLFNPQPYMPITGYYTLELSGKVPVLSRHEDTIDAPDCPKHGSSNSPWFGYDSATYALALDTDRGKSFYARLTQDLTAVEFTEPLPALARTLKSLAQISQIKNKNGTVSISGLAHDTTIELEEGKRSFKINKSAPVVPTWNGVPIIHHPEFRAKFVQDEPSGSPTHTDLVTSEPCVPISKHHQIKGVLGTGGWAPLFSTKFAAYAYYRPVRAIHSLPVLVRQENGDNFPVSARTSRIYALGLTHAKKVPVVFDTADLSFACWPLGGKAHPVIDLVHEFFTARFKEPEEADAFWARVRQPLEAPDTTIHILMLRGAKGRISVLNWTQMHAADIRAALLRLADAFGPIVRRFSFTSLRLKIDPAGGCCMDPIRSDVAWALLTGTKFPDSLKMYLAQLFGGRPISSNEKDSRHHLDRNISRVAAWTALMEGTSMTPNDDTPIEKQWDFQAEVHPTKFFDIQVTDTHYIDPHYIFGVAIGLAEYLPVYYFRQDQNPLAHRGYEWDQATSSPKIWLGTTVSRFHPYAARFEKSGFARGRILLGQWMQAIRSAEVILTATNPIQPSRKGDVARGFYAAGEWARKFFYSKHNPKPEPEPKPGGEEVVSTSDKAAE
jgi:hypothetical protein